MVPLGEIVLIHELHRQGLSISAIASQVGVDRKTVRHHIKRGIEPPAYKPREPKPRLIDLHTEYIQDRIRQFPTLTAQRLLREITERGYTGKYTQVRKYVASIKPTKVPKFEVRFETPPGQQAQVDFAEFQVAFTDEDKVDADGVLHPTNRKVWLFSFVLGNSRWLWGTFCPNQNLATVLRCHVAVFEHLRSHGGGGVEEILYDRMKTAVVGEDANGVVTYNSSLLALLNYYDAAPRACKAYRAKTKGKIERPYRYVREDFFLGRTFKNLDDLNAQFEQWRTQVANPRVHATINRIVDEAFADECKHMKPLPGQPYDAVLSVERRITRDGMVSVDGNLYSVPDGTKRRTVEVQTHTNRVNIYEGGKLIAGHAVSMGKNQRIVDPSHRVLARRKPPTLTPPTSSSGQVAVRSLGAYEQRAAMLAGQPVSSQIAGSAAT